MTSEQNLRKCAVDCALTHLRGKYNPKEIIKDAEIYLGEAANLGISNSLLLFGRKKFPKELVCPFESSSNTLQQSALVLESSGDLKCICVLHVSFLLLLCGPVTCLFIKERIKKLGEAQ